MFEDAVKVLWDFSSGVLFDVFNELIVGLSEGDVVMVTNEPVQIWVVSSTIVVSIRRKDR